MTKWLAWFEKQLFQGKFKNIQVPDRTGIPRIPLILADDKSGAKPNKASPDSKSGKSDMPVPETSSAKGTQVVYAREKYRDSFELFYHNLR